MAVEKTVKVKGGYMSLVVGAEVLFVKGQMVHGWTQRFANRLKTYTAAAAPTHNYGKRPLRPHPGTHLNKTFIVGNAKSRLNPNGGMVLSAMGSTSPYALFVDQGTSGQMAKILPPWSPGSGSLFEASHITGMAGAPGPKFVRGQEARHFFDAGLSATMRYMTNRSFQKTAERGMLVAGSGGLSNLGWTAFFGNSAVADATFWGPGGTGRLEEWRRWRDESWGQKEGSAPKKRVDDKKPAKQKKITTEADRRQEQRRLISARERARKWVAEQKAAGELSGSVKIQKATRDGGEGFAVLKTVPGEKTRVLKFFTE